MKNLKEQEITIKELSDYPPIIQTNKTLKTKNLLIDIENEDFESIVNSTLHSPQLTHHKNTLSSAVFFTSSDINSFEKDRLDKLLYIPSEESCLISEGLIMDDEIDFCSEPASVRISATYSSAFNTTLNYTRTETMSSIFDSFYAANVIRFSLNNSQNYSKCLTGKSYDTQEPGNILERLDLDYYLPTERFTLKRQQMIEEKIKKGALKDTKNDESYTVSSSLLNRIAEKPERKRVNGETSCCTGCVIS